MTSQRRAAHLLASLTLLSGCKGAHEREEKAPEKPIRVQSMVVQERPVPELVTITGVLEADQRSELAANASGRVKQTLVERGQHVKAGDPLVFLDARAAVLSAEEARANVATAREQLSQTRADCARYAVLLEQRAITQQEFERAATQCRTQASAEEAARARAAQARKAVGDAVIRAPFAGVVAERFVSIGDYVRDDSKVVTVLVDNPLRLELTVPEANIASARTGVVVSFDSLALPGRTFQATIRYVGQEIRQTTRDLVVEAIAQNDQGLLVPGMFVTAHLPVGTQTVPVVPQSAVVEVSDARNVFAIVNQRLEQRVVQPGAILGNEVEIVDGLRAGERIVTNPSSQTVDGVRVE